MECIVVVPEGAPETKIAAIERLGARVVSAPYEDWLQIFRSRSYEGMKGLFIDDFSDPAVMAGHGTTGLEILEDLPDVEAALVAGSRAACVPLSQIPSFTPARLRQRHPWPLRLP